MEKERDARRSLFAGVDVGGPKKGYHVAVLSGQGGLETNCFKKSDDVVSFCLEKGATIVGVDAPCGWSSEGRRSRRAEQSLMRMRIHCFFTPTRDSAIRDRGNRKAFYQWMLCGEELYESLKNQSFHLYREGGRAESQHCCFETFPHAIAQLLCKDGETMQTKREKRLGILDDMGVETTLLKTLDHIDATLCALMARRFARGQFETVGDAETGFIVIPRSTGRAMKNCL